jgi:ADP-ribose pyrophosphatase YjhB (NUDIX family)
MSKNICVFGYATQKDKILLVQHSYGHERWHLPGGAVEKGESLEDAMLREFKEETGFEGVIDSCEGSIFSKTNYSVAFLYKVGIARGSIRSHKDKEIQEIGFFAYESMPSNLSRYALNRISVFRSNNVFTGEWN